MPRNPILPLLKDADESVRAVAAFALSKVGDRQSIPALLSAWNASTEAQHHLRRQLMIALGDIGEAAALAPILEAFGSWSPELQELALGFITSESEPGRTAHLQRLLGQELPADARAMIEKAMCP